MGRHIGSRGIKWQPDQVQTILRMRAANKSASQIARKLKVTRSAVLGKIRRLKAEGQRVCDRDMIPAYQPALIEMYEAGFLTVTEIARKLAITPDKAYHRVHKLIAEGALAKRRPLNRGSTGAQDNPLYAPKQERRFADAMNGRRYEDGPIKSMPLMTVSRPPAPISLVGCASEMCAG